MGKGRSSELIKRRNEALVRRYYYLTEVQRLRFDDTVRLLAESEFFLSEQRVMAIIRAASRRMDSKPCDPVPQVKMPRITRAQLDMLRDDPDE